VLELRGTLSVSNRTPGDIIRAAEEMLATARLGLTDLNGTEPERKFVGLRNLAVFGRAVTNVLQNLRAIDRERFDRWYEPYRKQMEDDELMRFFYELRTEILKRGNLPASAKIHIHHLKLSDDLSRFGPPPKGAVGFFIGDSKGRSGWEVKLPDGSTEIYYVQWPEDIMTINVLFSSPPSSHLGRPIGERTAESLGKLYFEYLRKMLADAHHVFAPP